MSNRSPNPYFNLATIRNVEMFFGRTSLLRRFYAALANRQSVSILGQRRIGKSSFLWCSSRLEMQARFSFDLTCYIFVFLDLHEYFRKTSEDFFRSVSKEIIDQSPEEVELILPAGMSGAETFSNVLDQVVRQGFFPVLLLDSFDKVTLNEHFGPDFFGFLRAQASRGRVSYVTASFAPLYEVCHRGIEGSPFFNIFYTYKLEALAPQEARELITMPAIKARIPFTEAEVASVLRLAGRHPFFIQRVCHSLFEEKGLSHGAVIDDRYLGKLAYTELQPHFQNIWEQLSEKQQRQLRQEIQYKGNVQREMPEFSESALFKHFMTTIRRADPIQVELFQIRVEELEKALGKINDPNVLGGTSLRHMQTVSRRLERNASPSDVERGLVIREVLREACERLRASGNRSDYAAEWRFYNILYYKYFDRNHRLTNEHIAARLGLGSVRQFYRERTKAIEALLNVLFEMERELERSVTVQQ